MSYQIEPVDGYSFAAVSVASTIVPRVGETVVVKYSTYMVSKVIHLVIDGEVQVVVKVDRG